MRLKFKPARPCGCIALRTVTLVLCFCLAALPAAAADHHGQVRFGGLPVPGASVTASQGEKSFVTITDLQGNYSFPDLSDGTWIIRIEMLCFSTISQEVPVAAGAPGAEWELKILPLSEIHTAAGTPVPTTTAPASKAGVADPATAINRNRTRDSEADRGKPDAESRPNVNQQGGFQRADLAASGSNTPAAAAAPDRDSGAFAGQSADELVQRAADGFLINGSSNNSASSLFGLLPAFGNVRKGLPSLYNGNLGLILDNSALDARPYSFTGQNTSRPAYNRLTGVASFGGPLKIPHLVRNGPVVVVNYQWTRNRNVTTQPGLMPTEAERNGDFSQSLNAMGQPVRIFDPATGRQFSGNAIPENLISRQAKALLDLFPFPNFAGNQRYNYQVPVVGITHQDGLQSRVNKSLDRSNQLSGSFDYQSTRTDAPNLFGFLDKTNATGLSSSITWRHSFTLRLLAIVGSQYSRLATRNTSFFQDRRNISGEAGISGNNQDPVNWGPPDLVFSGGIAGLSDGRPSFHRNQTNAISYGMYWSRGRHNLSFGADFRRQQFNYLSQQDARGTFTFTGTATQAVANGLLEAGTGSDWADFLLGLPATSSVAFGNADKYFRASSYDAYVTDDMRVNPGLTLNAGVRWEYGSPITEIYDRLVNLDIAPGFAAVAPVVATRPTGPLTGKQYPRTLLRPDRRDFQPRVGIAWRPLPASSLVIRAGYGIYFNTSVYTTIAVQMAQQSPLSKSLRVQNSPEHPFNLANGFNGTPSSTASTFAVDPDFRVGYVHSWQLSIQRDLPGALMMTLTYLGSKGTRGVQQFLPNTFPAGAVNPCPSCPSGFVYLASNGNATREAGQVQLRRRLRSGFTATLQYAYSKSIDDAALGGRGQGSPVIAQNWLDLGAERALSNFDQRHLMSLQLQYTSGMGLLGGALAGGWKGRALKEWTLATQLTAGSGFPLTPILLTPVRGTGVTGSLRPDYTGAAVYDAPAGLFLNPAAYAAPAPGQWGNAGRNSITGPAQFSLNVSMGRTFRIKDRVTLDLRVDAANAINHATFPAWNTTVSSAQFGLPGVANPMRSLQTTLRARF